MEKVLDFENISADHSIEWGNAEWTKGVPDKEKSIRNRYNLASGKFNRPASCEVPWNDFNRMILESIRHHQFEASELIAILKEIVK